MHDDEYVEKLNRNPQQQRFFSKDLANWYWSGYPVPNPEPEIGPDGKPVARVEVGDVGYISSEGKFSRLFNMHLEPGVDGQPALFDLPKGFVCAPPKIRMRHWTCRNTSMYAHVPEAPENWREKIVGWGDRVQRSLGHEPPHRWRPNAPGAILIVDQNRWRATVQCEDALNVLHYTAYVQTHARSWHEFASSRYGLELEDLILVTGMDRGANWVTAVHDGKKIQAFDFGPKTPYPDEASRRVAEEYWKECLDTLMENTNVKWGMTGPGGRLDENDEKAKAKCRDLPESNGRLRGSRYDQTLFLHYVRAKRRPTQEVPLVAEKMPNAGTSSEYLLEKSGLEKIGVVDHGHKPQGGREPFTDSLEPVLDYIMRYSDADIAVAHSGQIYRLPGSFWEKCLDAYLLVKDGVGVLSSDRADGARRLKLARVFADMFLRAYIVE
ncbi:unnamed protein product [Peniophora sp. CBMAI 1063]|nr:unnamed protein product [Peniophora sp. CBMAI 1063]